MLVIIQVTVGTFCFPFSHLSLVSVVIINKECKDMMLLPLKASVKPFKRQISQCSYGMSNERNSTEFEADEYLACR